MGLTKKVMVLFDPEEFKKVEKHARLKGISVAKLIRNAVEKMITEDAELEKKARLMAARRLVEAEEPVLEWDELERIQERGHLA